MKIAIITRHSIINYGSLLQAMATQKIIEKLGYDSEIIDYIRSNETYKKREITLLKRKPDWYKNPLKRLLYLLLRQPESYFSGKNFNKEYKKYLFCTKSYSSLTEIENDKPKADIYMTGSDQVWGPVADGTYDSTYCLSFCNDEDKKISYAASFGHNEMNEELSQYYKKWLSRYSHIAVREDSAVDMLSKIGIDAFQVLDPTLLLDQNEWNQYIAEPPKKKYILVYQLHNDSNLGKYAKKVAKHKGMSLIRVSPSFHQFTRPGRLKFCPNVAKFLSYIKNAECLITDSFHGTAFAINFNTPFIEVLPNNNTESRNISILTLTGLTDRILNNYEDVELADKMIDFVPVNSILTKKREESLKILNYMIEE